MSAATPHTVTTALNTGLNVFSVLAKVALVAVVAVTIAFALYLGVIEPLLEKFGAIGIAVALATIFSSHKGRHRRMPESKWQKVRDAQVYDFFHTAVIESREIKKIDAEYGFC